MTLSKIMTTYTLPSNLGDILGAHHDGNLQTAVMELKPASGVLTRGTVLAVDSGTGKLIKVAATGEANTYGVLLDESVDTGVTFADGTVTGSVAKKGAFRGPALIVSVGTNVAIVTDTLRDKGIYVEGQITAPAAATALEAEAPATEA